MLLSISGAFCAAGAVSIWHRFENTRYNRRVAKINLDIKEQELRIKIAAADRAEFEAGVLSFSRNDRLLLLPGRDTQFIEAVPIPAGGQGQQTTPLLTPPSIDFFSAMSDPLQAYAIIGPQRIGKSVLIQQLTAHYTRTGQQCVVIGTKAGPDEWPGCEKYIGGADDSVVPDALERIYREAEQRIGAHVNRPLTAIILDDWLNTAEIWPEIAERFFIEAATRMLTGGFVPYFILQSDSKSDWGIKHGAQLKNNFTHVMLRAPRLNGRLNHAELTAHILYPGEKERHLLRLPYSQPVIVPDIVERLTPQEGRVLEMLDAGASVTAIAKTVFGGDGGNQLAKVREIVARLRP